MPCLSHQSYPGAHRLLPKIIVAVAGILVTLVPIFSEAAAANSKNPPDTTIYKPESVGFSSARLERLHAEMQQSVDNKQLSGAVTLLARHGKIIDYRSYGKLDMEKGLPMPKDAIFRDYSMTKPVTGVAMMILYEEGKWRPSDPVSKYIPEFAHLKVCQSVDAQGQCVLTDPRHAPTMEELMMHTAGFARDTGDAPVPRAYREMQAQPPHAKSPEDMIDKLSRIPLHYQPGTMWMYSLSMDIQGYIIQKISGQSLPEFMRSQIFAPLNMPDADFYVPAAKRARFATLYENDRRGGLKADTTNGDGFGDYSALPAMASGGGGLVSTTLDYFRFAQMLLNGGEYGGKRILSPASVKMMLTNHLPASMTTGEYGIGDSTMRPGFGWGYDTAVEYDPVLAGLPDGKGTFTWDGAAGTWFWADPANDIVFVGMIQRVRGGEPNIARLSHNLVYQALVDPSK